jgi:hypothetical protein
MFRGPRYQRQTQVLEEGIQYFIKVKELCVRTCEGEGSPKSTAFAMLTVVISTQWNTK